MPETSVKTWGGRRAVASVKQRIAQLKEERHAVILAHNYQVPEVQDIADFVGDSLGLSRQAAETDADVIVFCGVHFMAETAAILCPGKTVLLPDEDAGCPMADMVTAEQLRELKAEHPGAAVVCYVNSSAAVKAESDWCCTSANAVEVVESVGGDRRVIFVPDQNLGDYVAEKTGRDLVLWPGYCPSHVRILPSDVARVRASHPGAEVLVHPECPRPVREGADHVFSTGGMLRHVADSGCMAFIIGTELGILHRLRKENPGKEFHGVSERCVCPNMKRIQLEKVLWSLEDMCFEVHVDPGTAERAREAIDRMLGTAS